MRGYRENFFTPMRVKYQALEEVGWRGRVVCIFVGFKTWLDRVLNKMT